MAILQLHNHMRSDVLILPGIFIDQYLPAAKGDDIKVFLYLLRMLFRPGADVSLASLSDALDSTERELLRSLTYWEKQGLLKLSFNSDHILEAVSFLEIKGQPALSSRQTDRTAGKNISSPVLKGPAAEGIASPPAFKNPAGDNMPALLSDLGLPTSGETAASFSSLGSPASGETAASFSYSESPVSGKAAASFSSLGNPASGETAASFSYSESPVSEKAAASFSSLGNPASGETAASFSYSESPVSGGATAPFSSSGSPASGETAASFSPSGNPASGKTAASFSYSESPVSDEAAGPLSFLKNSSGDAASSVSRKPVSDQTAASLSDSPQKAAAEAAAPLPTPRDLTAAEDSELNRNVDFGGLIMMAEKAFGQPLNSTDVNRLKYWYINFGRNISIIESLLDYCRIQRTPGHTTGRYLDVVASGWFSEGIRTASQAKEYAQFRNSIVYGVMEYFGLKSRRDPNPSELALIRKWYQEYGFSKEMILLACKKTMERANSNYFSYADTILTDWHQCEIHTPEQVRESDISHRRQTAAAAKKPAEISKSAQQFHNFEERTTDYDALITDHYLNQSQKQDKN